MILTQTPDSSKVYKAVLDVYGLEGQRPEILARLLKAADLVTAGKVEGDRVRSQSNEAVSYKVTFDGIPHQYRCDCKDHQNGAPASQIYGGRHCKHTLAAHLIWFLG